MAFNRATSGNGGVDTNRSVRELLDSLALEDSKDDKVIKGFAPPRIRTLAKMAQQIADEHGIAQPAGRAPDEMFEGAPLKDLARILKSFTYGTMMQLDRELKEMPTTEGMAALLHSWAMKTLGLTAPPPQPNTQPIEPLITFATPLPPAEMHSEHPPQTDDPNLPPAA